MGGFLELINLGNQKLFFPSTVNGTIFEKDELMKIKITKTKYPIFLDFEDGKIDCLAGYVEDIRIVDGVLDGYVYILENEGKTRLSIELGMCGIAPKVTGHVVRKKMKNIELLSFGLITNPPNKSCLLSYKGETK